MRFVRQFLPLAALFGLLSALSGGVTPALGNVTSVSAIPSGNSITVTASYTNSPAGASASLTASGNGGFSSAVASGSGVTITGFSNGAKIINTTPDTSGNTSNIITIQATFACGGGGPVSFMLFQAGASPNSNTSSALCSTAPASNSTGGSITVTPNQQSIGQTVTVSAACQIGSVLSASPQIGSFSSATVSGAAINVGGGSVTCSAVGQLTAVYTCSSQGATTFTLSGATGASAALTCGTVANAQTSSGSNTGITLANPSNAGRFSPVSISVSPENIPCGGTATITVTANSASSAPFANDTPVNLYTTSGVIEPKIGVIKDGRFVTTLKAPATAGPLTINASVAGIANYVDVKTECGLTSLTGAVATPAIPASQPLTSPPPPPLGPQSLTPGGFPSIAPPNTGDAGLKARLD